MHVVILASARYPLAQPFAGGLEALTWHLVNGLRERGVEVTVFAGPGTDPTLGARLLDVEPLVLSDTARADVSMPPEGFLREHHAYLQAMLSIDGSQHVDVVHNNSLHYLPVSMDGTIRAPLLTTLHTPPTPWLEPAVRLSDAPGSRYVAVSEYTARQWRHVADVGVVPNGVDTEHWRPGPGGEALAWAGRLVPEKAPHLAIELASAAGMPLRLAGPVADPAYFEAEIRPRLRPGIEYLGHVASRELVELYGHSAATLVTPVWAEPYGLVAAESLACGTPVVAFDRGGLGEFVVPGVGVLLDPTDLGSAAAAIDEAVRLDRNRCREHAVQHCSLARMVDDYLGVYRDMAQSWGAA